ncbi:MAG: hypothetical protein HWN68_02195 [Desulfobacterales bacterium]|nr:hypothetical protein [Desulfobacterales bacterium]
MSEGWAFVYGARFASKKAHYIQEDHRSLCGRYIWLGPVEQGNDNSPDNCKECIKRLKKLRPKNE